MFTWSFKWDNRLHLIEQKLPVAHEIHALPKPRCLALPYGGDVEAMTRTLADRPLRPMPSVPFQSQAAISRFSSAHHGAATVAPFW
jgi:hypothetical protein